MEIDTFNGKPVKPIPIPEKEGYHIIFNDILLAWKYKRNN